MLRVFFIVLILCFTTLLKADEFRDTLEKVRQKYKIPALAAAVTLKGEIVAKGAVGVRKYGTKIQVTENDKFHIGSCTKSMTATLAGLLVDQGKIKWTSTLKEIFSDLEMHKGYQKSTLEQLLSHTAGFPNTGTDAQLWVKLIENRKLPVLKQRDFLLKTGTNTTNYTIMWVAPEKEFSVAVAANIFNKEIAKAVDEVASMAILSYLIKKK